MTLGGLEDSTMLLVTLLELAVLGAFTQRWMRFLVDPRRRLLRIAPREFVVLALLLGAGAAAAVLAALFARPVLHAATASALVLGGAAALRARPAYGRGRRWPPGSLGLSRSMEALLDREFYAGEKRRHGPIFKMAQFHRPVVCVVGLDLAHDLMRRHRDRLAPSPLAWNDEVRGGFLRFMDDASHEVYSAMFRRALSDPIVAAAEPATRSAARRELAALAAAAAGSNARGNESHAPGGRAGTSAAGVAPGAALDRIVLAAFARVLFGIDENSPALDDLARIHAVLREDRLSAALTTRSRAALNEFRALVERRVAEQRTAGSLESSPCTLLELGRSAPEMPDGVCVDNLLFVLRIAAENVGSLLRWQLKILGEHPQWSERLRAEVASGSGSATATTCCGRAATDPASSRLLLADRIVLETLRLGQSEYLYRVVRETFEFGGFVFPAGWRLRVCVGESHRDQAIWPNATKFDPDRFLDRAEQPTRYAPFGLDQHACNGVELTRMICRATLEELAAGFEWRTVRDGEIERDFRHWSHWRPSSRFAIAITPRAA